LINKILEKNININSLDKNGNSSLSVAIHSDNYEITDLLLQKGANPNIISPVINAPISFVTIFNDNLNILKLLVEYKLDIEAKDKEGNSLLAIAVYENNPEFVNYLLDIKANINSIDNYGQTPIFKTLYMNNISLFNILLDRKADIFIKDNSNYSPFFLSFKLKRYKITLKILNLYPGISIYQNFEEQFFHSHVNQFLHGTDFNQINEIKNNYSNILLITIILFFLFISIDKLNKKLIQYIPVTILLILIIKYGHSLITWDEWLNFDFWTSFLKKEYSIFFNYLLTPHFIHFLFFPRLIIFVISLIFGFNPVFFMILSSLIHLLCLKFILKKYSSNTISNFILLLLCLFFFSLRQLENFFWGFQIAFIFTNTTAVISFYYADKYLLKNKNHFLFKCIIFSIISSFSSLMGMITFIPLLLVLFIKNQKTFFVFTAILFISIIFLHLILYQPSDSRFNFDIIKYIKLFILYLGSSFFHNKILAFITGIFFLSVVFYSIKIDFNYKNNFFYKSIIFYSFFTGLLIIGGRSFWGDEITLVSRYSTFSITGFCGLFLWIKKIELKKHFIMSITILLILFSTIFNFYYGFISIKEIYKTKDFYSKILLDSNYGLDKIDYNIYFWDKNIIESNLSYIKNVLFQNKTN
jgi:ankyrin repeat protein